MLKIKELLSTLSLPLFGLAAMVAFYVVWSLLDLPPQEEIIRLARAYYAEYGLITIFISAILESVLMAGWYFPGSLVIVLGVIFAGDDLVQVGRVTAATTLGFLISYTFNFYVGRYGWYKLLTALGFHEAIESAKRQLVTYGPRAILFTYWHPNLAALTATGAGILDMPFRTFALFTVAATTLWNVAWATLGHALGETAITIIGPKFVSAFIVGWIAILLYRQWRKSRVVSAQNVIVPQQE